QLEAWLVDFDCRWAPGHLRARLLLLPAEAPWRRHALVEMVKIDLERRWQHGERVGLADYLRDFPELETLPADLLLAEGEVRRQSPDQPLTPAPHPAVPPTGLDWPAGFALLDDFEVEGVLGRGGMGVVYRVRQRSTGRSLAVKRARLADGDSRRRFLA